MNGKKNVPLSNVKHFYLLCVYRIQIFIKFKTHSNANKVNK